MPVPASAPGSSVVALARLGGMACPGKPLAWTMQVLFNMLVRDRMTRHLLTVAPEDNVAKARVLMREGHVDRLPVTDGRRVVGIITLRDIWGRLPPAAALLEEKEADDLLRHVSVGGVMSLNPAVVMPADGLVDAACLMREKDVRTVAVVDHGELVGLLTLGDVVDGLIALVRADGGQESKGQMHGGEVVSRLGS